MADHKHGTQDITDQEKTFEGFVSFTTKTAVGIVILFVLMAIFII